MRADDRVEDGKFPSTCWECSTVCGSLVTVKDGRVTRIGPNPAHPHSRGAFVIVNAAMTYDGPWDLLTGSVDTHGLPCRLSRAAGGG